MIKFSSSLVSFFWYFIRKRFVSFLFFTLVPICLLLETNVIPYSFKLLIDAMSSTSHNRHLMTSEIIFALYLGGGAWLAFVTIIRLQQWWRAKVIPIFEADIRLTVLQYVINHSYQYFSSKFVGNIAKKIEDLPSTVESIRMIICWNCISSASVVVCTLIMTFTVNAIFSLILGLWVMTHLVISIYFAKFVGGAAKENAEDKSVLSGSIVDIISNISMVQLFARQSDELIYATSKQKNEIASNAKLITTTNIYQLAMDIPLTVMLFSMIYCAVVQWQKNFITTGDCVFIFSTSFAVMYQMWSLGNVLTDLFRQIGVVKQAITIISYPHDLVDIKDARPLNITSGEIKFDNVTFYYPNEKNIFENMNLVIKPGQKVGLVGFSGSGKSTFLKLILRCFDLKHGSITIDQQNIAFVKRESLLKNISVVPQDISLFHRTLIENIRYGNMSAIDEEVIEASKKAYCHDFITHLKDGYNAEVGERGVMLSYGQRQRVAIARAILKDAPIIFLDEATSALDSVTEKFIQNGINSLINKRTTIMIAHRLSTVLDMDRILVFDNGNIIEDGTHSQLLQLKGRYALMWKMQKEGFFPVQKYNKYKLF